MKVIIEDIGQGEEEQIVIRCRELDESLMKLINGFKTGNTKITATSEGNIFQIEPKEIYYFEAVDNKVFLYGKTEVYETKRKLYEVENELEGNDFFRASKSVILNITKIKSLTPAFSGRLEALLKNGERVIISRQYVGELKNKLGL